jgi:hypothetical protein
MVNVVKGGGRAPPALTSQANFTRMTECTPESGRYHSVYSVGPTMGESNTMVAIPFDRPANRHVRPPTTRHPLELDFGTARADIRTSPHGWFRHRWPQGGQ